MRYIFLEHVLLEREPQTFIALAALLVREALRLEVEVQLLIREAVLFELDRVLRFLKRVRF